ncbi:hypothetical protein QBC40DRAFT_300640 [Triangularia verruculosa]|uniref:Uncharacterized protein n=1 Tax=Triangularia verruculosa TaxID=2587418 RepID=A0AAN6X8W4_9PEZI|nr:hypothetical protein QBC40DRAFT_300640 [Triangularia verruculosa]
MRPSLFSSTLLTGVAVPLLVSSLSIPPAYSEPLSKQLDKKDNLELDFELDKPPIQPAFSEDTQDKHLRFDYPRRSWTSSRWPERHLPEHCITEAQFNGLYPLDFEVRDVWFSDCGVPWAVCRHKDAKEKWRDILNTFSAVPVGMRQYVANLVILPGAIDTGENATIQAVAYTRGSVLVFSPSYFKLGVLFHEIAHIMDMVALAPFLERQGYPEGTPFSKTKYWKYAYGNDSAVPTPYARASWQEDFADSGRWAMSHVSRYRGLVEYSKGWVGCRTQIEAFMYWMKKSIFPSKGICTGKMEGGQVVKVVVAGEDEVEVEDGRKRPGTKVAGSGVPPIVMPAGAANMFFAYHGAA